MRQLLFLVAILFFFACKKDETTTTTTERPFEDDIKIRVDTASASKISLQLFSADGIISITEGYTLSLTYNKTTGTAWQAPKNVPITYGKITLSDGIVKGTTYSIKLTATHGASSITLDEKTVTTSYLTFKEAPLTAEDSISLTDHNFVYSLEGATHKVFGTGFSKENIAGQLVASSDTSKKVDVTIKIISDSLLTFQIPNVLSHNPFEYQQQFYLKLNNQYVEYDDADPARNDIMTYNVVNTDVHIDSLHYYPNTTGGCGFIIADGRFGVAHSNTYADYIYGVSVKVVTTHLSISTAAGVIVGSYDIDLDNNSNECGGTGTSWKRSHWDAVFQLGVNLNLSPGTYTVTAYNVLVDNSRKISNQVTITIK
ncbi:hypothetical protein [Chitinophaga ginsengisoli]|uniref:Uncharacterized protein n=1 Tax=Chitinophaga ginsengisoli TaxID=363837 RepID=A0A2P8G577_9BACT|nr:hypothetical protein [Chitinophaga ginsengisoli]PSL29117.1 hypothetical protein CLV42_107264 [Chitinophaga ginsengisoli]